jgi:hypothetical protein
MATFDAPTTTTLHGDGSDSSFFYNLPVPTRFRVWQSGFGQTDDFLCEDGQFEVVLGAVGTFTFLLSADGYDDLQVVFTALEPVPEEGEDE